MDERLRRTALSVWLAVLAAGMLITILLPAEIWSQPESDGRYSGFDPVLMYMDASGGRSNQGAIDATRDSLVLSAVPGSAPTVHLATSPLSYSSEFDVSISAARPDSNPLVVKAWAPYQNLAYQIYFEPEPSRRVLLQKAKQGIVIDEIPLGVYTLDQDYRVRVQIDRDNGSVSLEAATPPDLPFTGTALLVDPGPTRYASHIISQEVEVSAGSDYFAKALVRVLQAGPIGISVEWLDSEGVRIDIVSNWMQADPASGWFGVDLESEAPAAAAKARVEIATDQGASALFANVSLNTEGDNVLANGDFSAGAAGWRRAETASPLQTRQFGPASFAGTVTRSQWPELFDTTRMAITVASSSDTGLAVTTLRDHTLTLLHDRWLAVRVNDPRLRWAVLALGIAGIASLAALLLLKRRGRADTHRAFLPALVIPSRRDWAVIVLAATFIVGNAFLARVGSSNADVIGARTWGYTVSSLSPDELYFSVNLASVEAEQWSGLPLQEAGFPYGPTMAYVTTAQGLIHRLAFDSTGISENADVLIVLAKFTNTLFALFAAWLIYLTIRLTPSRRSAALIALAFILNPAIWFAGSVWGSSQSVSLVVLLLAIYFTMREKPTWAWLFTMAALMARPQYVVPVAIIAIYLLRTYPLRASVIAISKAIIALYVVFLPLFLAISPTLPVDNFINAFFLHIGSGNDSWTLPLSWGGLTIWPLVVPVFYGVSGVDRVLFPAESEAFFGIDFHQLGTALALGAVAILVVSLFARSLKSRRSPRIEVVLAAATMAFFTLNTATPTYHYVLPLALIVVARDALPKRTYWASVIAVSTTTFISMYAMGAYWLTRHPTWSVGIYSTSNPVSMAMASLANQDWYITLGAVVNLIVTAVLCKHALSPVPTARIDLTAIDDIEITPTIEAPDLQNDSLVR